MPSAFPTARDNHGRAPFDHIAAGRRDDDVEDDIGRSLCQDAARSVNMMASARAELSGQRFCRRRIDIDETDES
jgi:hypothetical protein